MMPETPFLFVRMPTVHFGCGKRLLLPSLLGGKGKKVLLLSGKQSFLASPVGAELIELLQQSGIRLFQESIPGEPSPVEVDRIALRYRQESIDWVVGIGGGSVLDAGKAISAMLPQHDSVVNYLEGRQSKAHDGRKIPFMAIPTSAGTGSEATKNAVLSQVAADGYKNSLRHDNFVPDIAVVDPELMLSCPPSVTAACGLDALTQLLEAYVSTKASPMTDALSLSGIEHFAVGFMPAVIEGQTHLEARSQMAYAALMSGICLANAGLGAVHGFAGPMGGYFDIPHGVVCGTLLGETTRVSIELMLREPQKYHIALQKYARAGALLSGKTTGALEEDIENLLAMLDFWIKETNIARLAQFGITEQDFSKILDKTDCKNAPVTLSREQLAGILAARL